MLKLVIADDEYRVCQLIENIIPWETYGIEICGIAYDGIKALEIIMDKKPDIVITDIRMPGYDGLKLIEKTKAFDPSICFILISGHRDFEYAQNAIKFGAEDYILKPISEAELDRIIRKIIGRKIDDSKKESYTKSLEVELNINKKKLKTQLAGELLEKAFEVDEKFSEVLRKEVFCDANQQTYQVIQFHIDHTVKSEAVLDMKVSKNILEKISNSVQGLMSSEEVIFLDMMDGRDYIVMINTDEAHKLSYLNMQNYFNEAEQCIEGFGEWTLTLCEGPHVDDLKVIHTSYQGSQYAKNARMLIGVGDIIVYEDLLKDEEELPDDEPSNYEDQIKEILDNGTAEALAYFIKTSIYQLMDSRKSKNPNHIYQLIDQIFEGLSQQLRVVVGDRYAFQEPYEALEAVKAHGYSKKVLVESFAQLCLEMMEDVLASKKVQEYKPIRIIKAYVEAHYMASISLHSIAKEIGFNSVYLSTLFKKETGMNFKEFLVNHRINKGKELLVDTMETVPWIAEQVGYKDARYFSKVFTKNVGLTPNEYRKVYS